MKKYNLIVIDPPWQVKKLKNKLRPNQINMDYPTMSIEEIKSLDIKSISEDNSYCFLWTTQKFLWQSKDILEYWGFNHLCTMVWEKTYGVSSGMAVYGFRWNAEFILIGTKGKKKMFPKKKLLPLVFQAENIRHSKKPDKFYELIKDLGEKRIDIFAREKREGWDVWGNEVKSDITLEQTPTNHKSRKLRLGEPRINKEEDLNVYTNDVIGNTDNPQNPELIGSIPNSEKNLDGKKEQGEGNLCICGHKHIYSQILMSHGFRCIEAFKKSHCKCQKFQQAVRG